MLEGVTFQGRKMGSFSAPTVDAMADFDHLRPKPGTGRLLLSLTVAMRNATPKCEGRSDEFTGFDTPPTPQQAEDMCSGCPLLKVCQEYGEAAKPYGVWGGRIYTEEEDDD